MYRKETEGWLKHYDFIIWDMLCLQIAFVLAYAIAGYGFTPYQLPLYRDMGFLMELMNLIVISSIGTLKNVLKRGHYQEFRMTLKHGLVLAGAEVFYLFVLKQGQMYSRLTFIMTFVIYIPLTYLIREWWKSGVKRRLSQSEDISLLIVTSSAMAEATLENIKKNELLSYYITGFILLDNDETRKDIHGISVVASRENAAAYVCREWVDEVLVILDDSVMYPHRMLEELAQTGVTIHLNLEKVVNIPGKCQFVEKIGNYTVLTTSMNAAPTRQLFVKRLMDIVGGLVGCILTGIIFLFAAPMIYLSSPGPIFFSQVRVGRNGKKFKMYKFRSMYLDAEERKAELMKDNKLGDAKMFKLDFDPRVIGNRVLPDGSKKTGIGHFLRETSLDEFPQFLNVLKGDMSIVGTRPPLIGEVSEYKLHHRARLAIKPGITGLWQVSGRSDITDFEDVVNLDKQYISQWTLGLDIKILLKTVMVVLKREGSV
ncbi:MAG: sugar transferase [Eubacteriales bacterium]|nr:sugar transferase [Eubacteriales bacterium]